MRRWDTRWLAAAWRNAAAGPVRARVRGGALALGLAAALGVAAGAGFTAAGAGGDEPAPGQPTPLQGEAPRPAPLKLAWEKNFLTISGEFPGGEIKIHYLEAYCRPGSTDREWGLTVIGHQTEKTAASEDGRSLRLRDRLRDGVVVDHLITAGVDEVTFELTATNLTDQDSQAHWAQPCLRVDKFTGAGVEDARTLVPQYARQCFLYVGGKLTRLPTDPWAEKARYTPGQVYCPAHVPREDVNPRPLSRLTPSHGLTGCYSADGKHTLAVVWEPYQEIFQGVIACMHADFRLGGLKAGETKKIRGKLYVTTASPEALFARYLRDFPEHAEK